LDVKPGTPFDAFIADLRLGSARGAALRRYRGGADDGPSQPSSQHILTLSSRIPARFESMGARDERTSVLKAPSAACLVPTGVVPLIRSHGEFELIVFALDFALVAKVDAELDGRPTGELGFRTNVRDLALQHLMKLLVADSREGSPAGGLYTDHLTYALACRFLALAGRISPKPPRKSASALPRHILRRVIERMRASDAELSLQALARESGYSQGHFARMFRVATGRSPHNYVLNLRIERARELVARSALSLADIAVVCGFSSHSHMTKVFRQLLGATPSDYRRNRG